MPAPVAMSILKGAEKLIPLVQWDPLDPRLQLLRALVASISSYVFFNSGECNALCLATDMVITTDHITIRLREEKGKKSLRAGLRSTRRIACSDLPRVGHLLRAYFAGVNTMGPPLARRWALCREEDKTQCTVLNFSTWLHAAFTTQGTSPSRLLLYVPLPTQRSCLRRLRHQGPPH
jgi:hypothetical protein